MATVTKKELIDRIADRISTKQGVAKRVIQAFLDAVIDELSQGNRLEFRDFGVFEPKDRMSRTGQNPKTLEQVLVPAKRTVKFKAGRTVKKRLQKSLGTTPPIQPRATGDGSSMKFDG